MTSIGYMRFNLPIDLDYSRASINTKGTDRRLGILEALVLQGFEVKIYSHVSSKPHKHSLLSMYDNINENEINYGFLDKIALEENARKPDCDVLFIENGPTNTSFRYPDRYNLYPHLNGEVSYIYRTFDMIDKFEGLVVYFQHDSSLYFPFGEIGRKVTNSPISFGSMTAKMDLYKNKHYKLVTTANAEKMIEKFSKLKRPSYSHFESWQHIPVCYSKNIDKPRMPKTNPQWDVAYVGTQDKFRLKQLEMLLKDIQNGAIIGKWNAQVCNMQMLGQRGKHADVYKFYNNAFVGLQIPNKLDMELDNMTSRLVQIICGGSVALVSNYSEDVINEYGLNNYVVNSAAELKVKVAEVKSLSLEQRQKLNIQQLSKLKQWVEVDWKQILRE